MDQKQLQEKMQKAKDEAARRVADRGVVQFRADADLILRLYTLAEKRKTSISELLRSWVGERLSLEEQDKPSLESRVTNLEKMILLPKTWKKAAAKPGSPRKKTTAAKRKPAPAALKRQSSR
ncbi:MAG: hypothetical protein U0105_22645 [Candidatus Obscuribacterales bacterium]